MDGWGGVEMIIFGLCSLTVMGEVPLAREVVIGVWYRMIPVLCLAKMNSTPPSVDAGPANRGNILEPSLQPGNPHTQPSS
ncbi:hypothetical protein HOY82DRAFT_557558 [Tuber indicum]|nr:hypothetical protein HOY82DRAFT_557558 [Tuber indicum]